LTLSQDFTVLKRFYITFQLLNFDNESPLNAILGVLKDDETEQVYSLGFKNEGTFSKS